MSANLLCKPDNLRSQSICAPSAELHFYAVQYPSVGMASYVVAITVYFAFPNMILKVAQRKSNADEHSAYEECQQISVNYSEHPRREARRRRPQRVCELLARKPTAKALGFRRRVSNLRNNGSMRTILAV